MEEPKEVIVTFPASIQSSAGNSKLNQKDHSGVHIRTKLSAILFLYPGRTRIAVDDQSGSQDVKAGAFYPRLSLISASTSRSPLGKEIYSPELRADSSGISASSEYLNMLPATALSAKTMVAGSLVSGVNNGCSEETTIPMSWVKLVTNPDIFAVTEPSAEVNHASTRIRSVTNRCSNKLACSGEIMLALMVEDFGHEDARFWCQRLGIYP
jgi:hypothetical protein